MHRIDEILAYWFTDDTDQVAIAARQSKLWWGKDNDDEIRAGFGADLDRALGGELAGWAETARGRLALILLLDQVSRCIHRGTPAAFAGDPTALALSREGIARGHDRELRSIERVFGYMPLMHAEDRAAQTLAVQRFEALAAEPEGGLQSTLQGFVGFAERHRAIVERFGRFPHRNAILGRESTSEEVEFLKLPGSGF